ncbi:MAG: (d)CMP kinase [Victivallaceae bacterium]|nr:(d)CMP kinase [Victivallaceae bacterium]
MNRGCAGARSTKSRVIAIDGPAGSGKSSVAAAIAARLRIPYISTGAMYRALAWAAGAPSEISESEMAQVLERTKLGMVPGGVGFEVEVNGTCPGEKLREPAVSNLSSKISAFGVVREYLKTFQQSLASCGYIVMEGRDIGTEIFPDAVVKIFLTASCEARAKRRVAQEGGDLAVVTAAIRERDFRDTTRALAPLRPAVDAVVFDSSNCSFDETVAAIFDLVTVHRTPYRVSYGDTDQMGVVYYANYLEFFERGRTEMLRSVGLTYRELETMGAFLPVSEARCRYHRSAKYDDLLAVRTWIISARGARLVIGSEVRRGEELLVSGEVTLGCLDSTGRPRRLPHELVESCAIYIKPEA